MIHRTPLAPLDGQPPRWKNGTGAKDDPALPFIPPGGIRPANSEKPPRDMPEEEWCRDRSVRKHPDSPRSWCGHVPICNKTDEDGIKTTIFYK